MLKASGDFGITRDFLFTVWQVFSISTTREYCWDEVRKLIMTQVTNEPQLSVELFKTAPLNLRPHTWKPEKVRGWSDPAPSAHHADGTYRVLCGEEAS